MHIFILRCLRLVSTLVFQARFDLSHKKIHVRTMLYTERSVQKTYLKPRDAIYDILLKYSKFKMQHIVCMCDSNVHTNIKQIWVLFNKIHFWTWSKVLKYQNKTRWESYIFDLPSHQTWNTWRWKRWKTFYQTWIKPQRTFFETSFQGRVQSGKKFVSKQTFRSWIGARWNWFSSLQACSSCIWKWVKFHHIAYQH